MLVVLVHKFQLSYKPYKMITSSHGLASLHQPSQNIYNLVLQRQKTTFTRKKPIYNQPKIMNNKFWTIVAFHHLIQKEHMMSWLQPAHFANVTQPIVT